MSLSGSNHETPHGGKKVDRAYEFQETYEGLGELEEDDAFNSETFGVSSVGKDFDFGNNGQYHSGPGLLTVRPEVSYARVAANDDDFMKDLWGMPAQRREEVSQTEGQDKKFLSLEEIEAQLTDRSFSTSHDRFAAQPSQFYGGQSSIPQAPYPNYLVPPLGFIPPLAQFGLPGAPPFMALQHPNGFMVPPGPGIPNAPFPSEEWHHKVDPRTAATSVNTMPVGGQPGPSAVDAALSGPTSGPKLNVSEAHTEGSFAPDSTLGDAPKEHEKLEQMAEFPLLGTGNLSSKKDQVVKSSGSIQGSKDALFDSRGPDLAHLTPEQRSALIKRQDKVGRIMRYSGIMNPKDKDFVTRFQLSQIVTDDPYNEDFYAQVYRVIHPKSTPGALGPSSGQPEPNSIAQAYLDQSGHRLGGRFKRADVALQRMQQQVQKAVSVAKERQSLPHNEREGVLGKVSVGSGKKPRQQLTILSKAAQRAKDNAASSGDSPKPIQDSPATATTNKTSKKYTKKHIMAILEDIINNLIAVESLSRSEPNVNNTALWNALCILDSSSYSGDEELIVNPFIQCLNYEKTLKILPRLFKFLTRDQTLTIVTLVMSNLENLTVIKEGSYTTYHDKIVPAGILKLVDLYSLTFCKVLMNSVQDFKFHEIIGLLVILIQHNVVSFVSTTKIGLSILTSLLSRAELIKGEGSISATDLSEWTSCYDELFTALESRIAAIFPPCHEDSQNDYVWQFLATLSLGGKLSHQRIIVDEVRDEIFGVMNRAKAISNSDMAKLHEKQNMLNNLNMYLVVMGLVANENEILELQS